MAYRSKLMRFVALLAFACMLTTQSYAQGVGGETPDMAADLEDGPEDKDPKEINEIEIIHRRNLQLQANRLINEANQLLSEDDKDYLEAIDKYVNAEKQLKQISESHPDVLAQLKELEKILGRTYRDYAKQLLAVAIDEVQLDKFQESAENINKAIQYDQSLKPEAQVLLKLIKQKKEQAEIEEKTRPENIDPEYQTRLKEILIERSQAKVFHKHRIWKRARDAYESILLRDPANEEAVTGLRRIYTELRASAKMRRRAQEAERMSEIEWKWIDSIPPKDIGGTARGATNATDRVNKDEIDIAIRKKLESIVISKISFADTRVSTVFEFLKNRSRSIDPAGEGVNFMLILQPAGKHQASVAAPAPKAGDGGFDSEWDDDDDAGLDDDDDAGLADDDAGVDDAFSDDFATKGGAGGAEPFQEPTITMDFDNIPLGQAIKYICEQANLRYKIEEHAIVILGSDVEIGNLELRFFPIDPRIFSASGEEEGEGGFDYKSFFEKMGVTWPTMSSGEAASISYDRGTSQLIVRNTPENLLLMDQILRKMNIPIPQVTIEAKFVEVRQNSLEELSFQWLFNGRRTAGSPKTYQAGNVDVDVNSGALAETTRSLGSIAGTALTETFNLDTIIGHNAFDTMVYFLNRKDGTDVLSAPKVTVQSGQEAFISMVEERMFPESFEEAEFQSANQATGFTPSSPVFGEPRQDLGVTLTVTPQVGNDNLSINLDLHPKVVAFLGYDTTFNSTTNLGADPITGDTVLVENRYDTPIFETRELRTQVTVWDGESVVLGGTITDELVKVDDKVPIVGDLPFIGRLFKSQGEQSRKKNLLMFVSARIIDPAGIPLRDHAIRGLPDYRR